MVAVSGHVVVEGFVGSMLVVDDAPVVESVLELGEGLPGTLDAEEFLVEGGMEPFFFAEGLGVTGTGMNDSNSDIE